jgi:hypothetical protein
MRRLLLVLVLLVPLAACGVSYEDRALSAGLMGATLGVGMGAGGVALGATIGVATGTLITSDQLNLGEPVWD